MRHRHGRAVGEGRCRTDIIGLYPRTLKEAVLTSELVSMQGRKILNSKHSGAAEGLPPSLLLAA